MDNEKTISRVIPDGEMNCIWAEAGMVSYKLCDRNYECDACPFDQVMRQKTVPVSAASAAKSQPGEGRIKQDTLLDVVRNIFDRPLSDMPPGDRLYSPGHVWMKKSGESRYRVGVDHYIADMIGEIGSVVLPRPGSSLAVYNPLAWMICGEGTLSVQSPFGGRIMSVNDRLIDSAQLLKSDPYGSGWLCEILAAGGNPPEGLEASSVVSQTKDRFHKMKQEILNEFDARPPALGVTMMDGGVRPKSLGDVIGGARFVAFLQGLLSR